MIKFLASIISTILLVSCSSQNSSEITTEANIIEAIAPQSCDQQKVISAFDQLVKGSKYVPTNWQPSEGTDLFDIYAGGGIACTYGIQTAEIGGTVMWAENVDNLWSRKKVDWLKKGQLQFDIPTLDEADAVILKEGATSADEKPVWGINLLINNVWIQINASFLQNIQQAIPIIQAAIDSTQPKIPK